MLTEVQVRFKEVHDDFEAKVGLKIRVETDLHLLFQYLGHWTELLMRIDTSGGRGGSAFGANKVNEALNLVSQSFPPPQCLLFPQFPRPTKAEPKSQRQQVLAYFLCYLIYFKTSMLDTQW